MTIATSPAPTATDAADDLTHIVCCIGDATLCGAPADEWTDGEASCPVCVDLENSETFCPVRERCTRAGPAAIFIL